MKFLVRRTSCWEDSVKPCKEAVKFPMTYVDRRTVKTIEAAKKFFWFNDWFNGGVNHREEKGCIACDHPLRDKWIVEISTLEELIKFERKYGRLVIQECDDYKEVEMELEIYDNYRE